MMAETETTNISEVSIVIVTSDRYDDLRHCLTELHAHLAKPGTPSAEVITVHGPNDDAAVAMVTSEFSTVKVLHSKTRHISRQRNIGAQAARGAVLVYLDDDAWPRNDWLRELHAAFTDERVVAASGPVFRGNGSLQCERLAASRIGRLIPIANGQPTPAGMSPSFSGCNLAIRRSSLLQCGGFDENLPYQPDDMDVCYRLYAHADQSRHSMCYREHAAVTHQSSPGPFRRSLEDRAWFTVARDNLYFAIKHGGLIYGSVFGTCMQVPKLTRFLTWMLRGKLRPTAFVRCFTKHAFGTIAGIWKGITHDPQLPLQAATEPAQVANHSNQEEAACQPPQRSKQHS
ncbi:MAG: GT2 family glycosyltransferase [Planctomycetota bacterium]|jgi:GT2 family glycosyltransferase